jgi:hypothetical protein
MGHGGRAPVGRLAGAAAMALALLAAGCSGGGHGTSLVRPAAAAAKARPTAAAAAVMITPANGVTDADPCAGVSPSRPPAAR